MRTTAIAERICVPLTVVLPSSHVCARAGSFLDEAYALNGNGGSSGGGGVGFSFVNLFGGKK